MLARLFRLLGLETITLQRAQIHDAPRIATIHAKSFAIGWGRDDIEQMFVADHVVDIALARNPLGSRLVGFAISRVVLDEAELLTIAIEPGSRGLGFSGTLLRWHAERIRRAGAATLFLEVAADNLAALALYRGFGFVEIGRRKGYYTMADPASPRRDAIAMRLDISGLDPTPRAF